ncbi:hypothetical protein TRFO_27531 [Tritrichomonas foetus]|uniref:Uncharacterized protein n=1 Tax=Tritrichomonas foetus TaxID=1144522 RepID=A0A1J4K616_9EUKA|nr:hypothetical protein TRFO_27531 [Tritrichomonas foetus]|eukprot:OHT04909.1 hypothetical protein TRFO_27531 [Tritrichomonas foetus]
MNMNIPMNLPPNPIKPEQNQKPITLSLTGNPPQNNYTPIVFRPLKDNGSTEFRPTRSFDHSLLISNNNFNQKRPRFEMRLPYSKVSGSSAQKIAPTKPFSHQTYNYNLVFTNNLSVFFNKYKEELGINISTESATAILTLVVQQLHDILLHSIQASRQRTNVYMPPVTERDITGSQMIKQHFLNLELYYSNKIRQRAFNTADMNGKEPYEPYFFQKFDTKKADIFSQDFNNEWIEQRQQNSRIFHSMRQRGIIFGKVAKETEKTYFEEIDNIVNSLKGLATKPAPYNPKAAEIFARAEEEVKKQSSRQITPKDIFEGLSRMPVLIQAEIPRWQLSYFDHKSERCSGED